MSSKKPKSKDKEKKEGKTKKAAKSATTISKEVVKEEAEEPRKSVELNEKECRPALLIPTLIKLFVPSMIIHWPYLRDFLRNDLYKYPDLVVVWQNPEPKPYLAAYNIHGKLLSRVYLNEMSRAEVNREMEKFDLIPSNAHEIPQLHPRKSMEFLFDPVSLE